MENFLIHKNLNLLLILVNFVVEHLLLDLGYYADLDNYAKKEYIKLSVL
jgi:hypothetical protein